MLSSDQKLARRLKRTRLQCGLSQAEAARRVGCSASWLCQAETGVRRCSRRLAEALEVVYGVKPGTYTTRYRFPQRGRRLVSPGTAEALRAILGAAPVESQRVPPTLRPAVPIRYDWKDWRGCVQNPLWPVAPRLGKAAQEEVERLEAQRPDDDFFCYLLNGMPFDSWTEKRFLVKLGLMGGELVRLAPARMGACARVVHGRTGQDARHRPQPAMVVSYNGLSAIFWPQRPVRCGATWKLDALVVVADGHRRLTGNIEIDGPDHDWRLDLSRENDLDLPTLRFSAATVNGPGFLKLLFTDLRTLLSTAR